MENKDVNHSRSSKYGTLVELKSTQSIKAQFITREKGKRYFSYLFHSQWLPMFNKHTFYVCGNDVQDAEKQVYKFLTLIKFF